MLEWRPRRASRGGERCRNIETNGAATAPGGSEREKKQLEVSIPEGDDLLEFEDAGELKARIQVIGVGGAGGNALNTMIRSGLGGCEFIVANTDAQALGHKLAPVKVQLGVGVTRGLGCGANPERGRAAAMEDRDRLRSLLQGSDMVFVTAGMGGGTGTGRGAGDRGGRARARRAHRRRRDQALPVRGPAAPASTRSAGSRSSTAWWTR